MTKCIYSYYRVITGQTDIDLKKLYSFIESNGGIDFVKVVFIITFESYYSYLKIPQYHGDGIVIDILNNFSQYWVRFRQLLHIYSLDWTTIIEMWQWISTKHGDLIRHINIMESRFIWLMNPLDVFTSINPKTPHTTLMGYINPVYQFNYYSQNIMINNP